MIEDQQKYNVEEVEKEKTLKEVIEVAVREKSTVAKLLRKKLGNSRGPEHWQKRRP